MPESVSPDLTVYVPVGVLLELLELAEDDADDELEDELVDGPPPPL